jgi:hypothetical protein
MATITHGYNAISYENHISQLLILNGVMAYIQSVNFWILKFINILNEKIIFIKRVKCSIEMYNYSFNIEHILSIHFLHVHKMQWLPWIL